MFMMVAPVMALFMPWLPVLVVLASLGTLFMTYWDRPGLPGLSNLAGPVQHFRSGIHDAWRNKVSADLCVRKGFRGTSLLDVRGSHQLLCSSHVRERDKMLSRSIMAGGVWNGFLLSKVRREVVPCRFCGGADGDGHLFWECPYPPLVEIRENPEFHDLMRMDKSHWPRCLLWHGWLPLLSGTGGGSPWADSADDAAVYMLESALGSYSSDIIQGWDLLKVLIGVLLLLGCLLLLMSGLMVVLFVMRFLVLLVLVLVFMLDCMLITGGTGVGGILMILVLLLMVCPLHVWVFALCLVPYRLFRWLNSGVWCLPCRLLMQFIWVLIISMLFGM